MGIFDELSVGVDDPWLGVSLSAKALWMRRILPTTAVRAQATR